MYYVYVLVNKQSGKIYIGQTDDLEKRVRQHNERSFRKSSYTKTNKGEWVLAYKEELGSRKESMVREKQLKSFRGREYIRSQITAR